MSSSNLHLHIISPPNGSIGEITNDLLPFFEKAFIITQEIKNEIPISREILLCHFIDKAIFSSNELFDSFKLKVLIQPIDGTSIKAEAVDMLNRFDVIITPAQAGRNIMVNNGVIVPILVIPNFFKADIFEKEIYHPIEEYISKDKLVFYHESTFHPRKGIELLYEAFIKAFSNDTWHDRVVLVLKDSEFNARTFYRNEKNKKQAIALQKSYGDTTPDILKFSCHLDDAEMKALWHRTDVYVSLAKLEGFGIPFLRMLLLDKPIICLKNNNSGYNDYLDVTNSYIIDAINITAKDEFMWLYNKDTEWAVPKIEDVINAFTGVAEILWKAKRPNVKKLSNSGSSVKAMSKFSLKEVAETYIEQIQEFYNKTN